MNHSLATDMPAFLTLAQLSALDNEGFVAAVGAVFEHSPWVMRRAWARRPFADRAALTAVVICWRTRSATRCTRCVRPTPPYRSRSRSC